MLQIYLHNYEGEKRRYDDLVRQIEELMEEWKGKSYEESCGIFEKIQFLDRESNRALDSVNAYARLVTELILEEEKEQ